MEDKMHYKRGITDPIDRHVAKRLTAIREKQSVSREKLGRHLGVTYQQISKHEYTKDRISAGRLYRMGLFFDVPVSYFFEGYEEESVS